MIKISCRYCQGTGKDPFRLMSAISTCACCSGRGVVSVSAEHIDCPHCRGSGRIKRFRCTVCSGKGVIAKPAENAEVCPTCKGSGSDFHIGALECLDCRGHGVVTRKKRELVTG